ncbi:MAG TPA: DEAD/DEAH box helicase, partial [Flavobacteriales bacterium]|nr:DEAD/DEAH box helicase [Flavobacteriales bacterium]
EPHPTMVVLVPTRELVIQVEEQARKLAAHNAIRIVGIYGGASINTQKEMLAVGVDLLVATPGRLIDLVTTGNLKLKNVKHLVIDEMDEMFGQGFRPQLLRIFDSLPKRRQNLLFSATITDDISEFLDEHYFGLDRVEAG